MSIDATPRQVEILRHSLGLAEAHSTNEYRNHYVAGKGHYRWDDLLALEAAGLMWRRGSPLIPEDEYVWHVTDAGKEIARRHTKPLSRGKRMYLKFLDVADTNPDLTFREFLTSPYYAESRASA